MKQATSCLVRHQCFFQLSVCVLHTESRVFAMQQIFSYQQHSQSMVIFAEVIFITNLFCGLSTKECLTETHTSYKCTGFSLLHYVQKK